MFVVYFNLRHHNYAINVHNSNQNNDEVQCSDKANNIVYGNSLIVPRFLINVKNSKCDLIKFKSQLDFFFE